MSSGKKVIFILGAGIMQIPAIRAAKELGWEVIVADGNPLAEGIGYADRFERVDLRNLAAMAEKVRTYRQTGGVDGVFTAGTDFSTTVAWVAEQCGLPGISYETALDATDKGRMRAVFAKNNIPQPDFCTLQTDDDPLAVLKKLSLPLVIKPVDNMGARGVRRVDNEDELVHAFQTALGFSRSGRVIIEEYMSGPEFSLDALVVEGEPVLCGLADRHICFEPHFVEMGHTLPAACDEKTHNLVREVFFKGIRALGIRTGAAKGDIKLTPRGPLVGEIAARLSGGYMSGWTFPYATGVELTKAALRLAIGLPPGDLVPSERAFSAERAFISIPGVIKRIYGAAEAQAGEGVKDFFLRTREGAQVVFPHNNIEKCGNVITKAALRDQAIACAQEAIARLFIRLMPDNPDTSAFLFGDTSHFQALKERKLENVKPWYGDPDRFDPDHPVVLSVPGLAPNERDWHGVQTGRILSIVSDMSGAVLTDKPAGPAFVIGRLFCKALIKGSAQGAVYFLDTARQRQGNKKAFLRFLEEGL